MEIVEATHADVNDQMMKLASDFYNSTSLVKIADFCSDTTSKLFHDVIDSETCLLLVAKDGIDIVGFIGMALQMGPFCKELIFANELFWYVRPESRKSTAGLKLFNEASKWAKEMSADAIYFVAIEDDKVNDVSSIYTKKSFELIEHGYMRRL